jgi:endonuclease YncB( thermonuclease family)
MILVLFFQQQVYAIELSGLSKIVDGDTVYIKSSKIRLEGIDAPEIKQKCKKNGKEYFCGKISQKKLIQKIGKNKIKCFSTGKDKYRRYLATCFIGKINLNKWMVRNGYAVSYRRYSTKYNNDEIYAKINKLGIWSGSFIQPEKWRKLN